MAITLSADQRAWLYNFIDGLENLTVSSARKAGAIQKAVEPPSTDEITLDDNHVAWLKDAFSKHKWVGAQTNPGFRVVLALGIKESEDPGAEIDLTFTAWQRVAVSERLANQKDLALADAIKTGRLISLIGLSDAEKDKVGIVIGMDDDGLYRITLDKPAMEFELSLATIDTQFLKALLSKTPWRGVEGRNMMTLFDALGVE